MPPADEPGVFREKALERLSSPERLDQLLTVTGDRSWIPLSALSVLVVLLLGWSVVAEIPVTVEGRGLLIRPRQVVGLQGTGEGRLDRLDVHPGQLVERGEVLGRIALPDIEKQLDLQRAKVAELTGQSLAAGSLRELRTKTERNSAELQEERLRGHIGSSQDLARSLREKQEQAVAQDRVQIEGQLRLGRELAESLRARLAGQEDLHRAGILSRQALDEAQTTYMDALGRLSDLDTQARALRTRELEIEEQYLQRLQRVDDLKFELEGLGVRDKELAQQNLQDETTHERQVAEVLREVGRLERRLEEEGRIVSEHAGTILELSAVPGDVLEPGDRLGSIEIATPGMDLQGLCYFAVGDGKRLERDMKIQITPDTAERARFGSIRGRILSVSRFPVTQEEASSAVGNATLAGALTAGGRLIEVIAELEREPSDPARFRWTSSKGPALEVSGGTTTSVRVAVEHRRPIAFVLPFLKTGVGLD